MIAVTTTSEVAATVGPAVLAVDGVRVVERDDALDRALAEAERTLRAAGPSSSTVSPVRAMYRAFGVDPTKTRPSSEALLRRIRKGEPLPRINGLVDIGNWCSVEAQLPFGLYDLSRIEGDVELRVGRPGEEYAGIRKDVVHVAGRLTLADAHGPFGNPTADSARTMITTATTRALIVIFAPAAVAAHASHALQSTEQRVLEYAGGEVVLRQVPSR